MVNSIIKGISAEEDNGDEDADDADNDDDDDDNQGELCCESTTHIG